MYIYIHVYICSTYIIYIHTTQTQIDIHTHTMKHYSAIKKNEILLFVTTRMYLCDIMLSEMLDRERQILYVITLCRN